LSFSELGLNEAFAATIQAAGYENPTDLQKQLIPLMTEGKSVIIWTQSASGKTGAFLIPAINYILANPLEEHRHARILILTSRRDRVNQINYTIKRLLGDEQQIRSGFIVSGRPYQPQMRLLRRPLDLMIATPGRLNDLVDNNKADFSKLEMLIIDDLSAIYQKGLHGLVNKILTDRGDTPYPVIAFVRPEDDMAAYARTILAGAQELEIEDDRNPLLQIPQVVHLADDYTHKIALMDHLLDEFAGEPSIIFTVTTKAAKALAESLANHGHSADVAASLPRDERNTDACPILIFADQDGESPPLHGDEHLIHFELPEKVEEYEYRLHNLALEGREEAVISLVMPRERDNLKRIEDFLGDSIEQCVLPGLAPLHHSSGFTPSVRSPRTNQSGQQRRGSTGGQTQSRSGRSDSNPRHSGSNQGRRDDRTSAPPQQATDQQRQRKGPYGRLNGGAQRKREPDNGYAPHATSPAPRRDQSRDPRRDGGGSYEIGSWEKPSYTPRTDKPEGDKKVVIRYKEKRRILTP